MWFMAGGGTPRATTVCAVHFRVTLPAEVNNKALTALASRLPFVYRQLENGFQMFELNYSVSAVTIYLVHH